MLLSVTGEGMGGIGMLLVMLTSPLPGTSATVLHQSNIQEGDATGTFTKPLLKNFGRGKMWLKTGPGPSSFSSSLHFNPPESFPFLDVKLFFSAFFYFPVSGKGLVPDLPAPVGPGPENC